MPAPINLYKTTIIIWSEYDASFTDLATLGEDACRGESYCSRQNSELIADPTTDPDWDGVEFFGVEDSDAEE